MRRAIFVGLLLLLLGCGQIGLPAAEPAKPSPPAKAASKDTDEDVYEMQRLLVDTIDQVQRNYVREVPRRRLVEAAIKGILSELDPYSNYISPEEMDQFRTVVESEFGGIGIQVTVDEGQLKVLSPLVGTPAYRAGVVAGDRILEIDGKNTDNITMDEAVRRLKGKEKTQVRLKILHSAGRPAETLTITREAIHIETVLGDHRNPDDTWNYFLDAQKKLAYIRVTSFGRDTAAELRKVLTALQKEKIRGLILDLRFNPGGLLSAAVEVSDLFVSQGRIVSTSGRNSPERVWEAHKEGTFEGFPMVVLVNRYSASASEIVAACLQDHKRAVIAGERTWGKGSVQNVIPLDDVPAPGGAEPRSALKLTTAGYRRPSGKNIDRAPNAKDADDWGVTPDKDLELRLDDRSMMSLTADRRHRDIVQPRQPSAQASAAASAQPPSKPEPGKPAAKEAPPAVKPGEAAQAPRFVDRQLQMALDYLNMELARAK